MNDLIILETYGLEEKDVCFYNQFLNSISLTYREIIKNLIIDRLEEGNSRNTIESYLRDLKSFLNYLDLKEKKLNQLGSRDIEGYKKYLLNRKKVTVKTVNRHVTSINKLMNCIGADIKTKQIKEQKQNFLEDVLTKEDVGKLLNCCNNVRDRSIMFCLYKTGMRVSEMLQLNISDVSKNSINITGKGGKHRDIFIIEELTESLREYLKVRKPTDKHKLFTGNQGALKRNSINKIIMKYAKIAGVKKAKAHPHSFRHGYGKALADNDVGIEIIADLLGHSDLNTTRIYTRKSKEQLIETIKKI